MSDKIKDGNIAVKCEKIVTEPRNRERVTDQEVASVRLPSGMTVSRSQYNSWYRFRARNK